MRSSRFCLRFVVSCAALLAASPIEAQPIGGGRVVIVSAASFEQNRALAPGTIATAFGDFAGVMQATAPPGQSPTTLGNAQVTVGGTVATVLYTSSTQINFVVPASLAPGDAEVVIRSGDSVAGRVAVQIERVSPAIFLRAGDATRPGLFLNANGIVNDPGNRARPGDVIAVVVTGIGSEVDPATTGAMVGLVRADALSIEPAGMEGVSLVRIRIPDAVQQSGQVPFALYTNGAQSNTVSLWLQ